MSDPKPLSRDQLARFLPSQEAIRLFERLFFVAGEQLPAQIEELTQQQGSGSSAPSVRSTNQQDRRFDDLELRMPKMMNLHPLESRLDQLEQQQARPVNLQTILSRLEAIEAYLGI